MNPKLQASGRKGGMTKGPTKARPLDPQRARNMALTRWRKGGVSVNEVDQSGKGNAQEAPGSILIEPGASVVWWSENRIAPRTPK